MERRKSTRKEWAIGSDDLGRSVLEWKLEYESIRRLEDDPLAQTYDLLQKLETRDLALEDEQPTRSAGGGGHNPYDTARVRNRGWKIERD